MKRSARAPLLLAVPLFLLLVPAAGWAACLTPAEVSSLGTSLRQSFRCARLAFDRGVSCEAMAPPACAGSGVEAALDLVLAGAPSGVVQGTAARRQARCQRSALRAAGRFLDLRVKELARDRRRARGARLFAAVERACDGVEVVAAQGGRLPTAGGACNGAVPGAGQAVDGVRMVRCARAALERVAAEMTSGVLRPNVVLVVTDDQNLPSAAHMARVSRLAARAAEFRNAVVTTPVCAPSRASLLSGRYAHRHGVTGNFPGALGLDESSTLATWLKAAGYTTGITGKYMNFAGWLTDVPEGWDEWQVLIGEETAGNGYYHYLLSENGVNRQFGAAPADYSTDVLIARGLEFIRSHADEPFFLLFSPFAPHGPALPAPRHENHFLVLDPWRPPNWHEPNLSQKPSWVSFARAITTPARTLQADQFRHEQLRSLLAADEAFGSIEDLLEKLGLTDNTVLVFTSDHGFHWGEHWWADKFTQYEESLRVPLVVSYPVESPEPSVHEELVANIDLPPTLAELAGAAVPPNLDGQSFVPLLRGEAGGRSDALIEMWGTFIVPAWVGVRGERYKYVDTTADSGVTEELYDVVADPHELQNLAADPEHADVLEAMRLRVAELRGP